jgi:GntR family transcriptional regulator, carbon starvation induced regulator
MAQMTKTTGVTMGQTSVGALNSDCPSRPETPAPSGSVRFEHEPPCLPAWYARPDNASTSITASVLARLRADILSARLVPGAKLSIKVLCYDYAAGITPLREALILLCGAGLVIQESQRGFSVAPTSHRDFSDVADCRRRLETMALALAIGRGDLAWRHRVAEARAAYAAVSARVGENAPIDEIWEERHRRFHFALISACGSMALLNFCAQLHDRFDRYRRIAVPTKSSMAHVGTDHDVIMAAAIKGDAAGAVATLDRHIAETAELVLGYYEVE